MVVVFVKNFTGSTIDGGLITGRKYEVERIHTLGGEATDTYHVLNEKGEKQVYSRGLFKTISEIRNEKLDELGINE